MRSTVLLAVGSLASCLAGVPSGDAPVYTYEIVNTYPHDEEAFTQGLAFEGGALYEGTGLYGRSSLRKVSLDSGEVVQRFDLPRRFFGEGVTVHGDRILQLTWRAHTGFVYDKANFELLREFEYTGEGWGMTHDGTRLIVSDGTSVLRFLEPETFEETGQLIVHAKGQPVTRLNELDYVQGAILANVWQTDYLARISPETGEVTAWIDLNGLLGEEDRSKHVDVLNGIAYDGVNDRLFVTGKLWPKLFEIRLVPQED